MKTKHSSVRQTVEAEEASCASAYYGTSAPKQEKTSHVGLTVTLCLLAIAVCSAGTALLTRSRTPRGNPDSGKPDSSTEIRAEYSCGEACEAPVLTLTAAAGGELSDAACQALLAPSVVSVEADFFDRTVVCSGVFFTENGFLLAGCGDLREADAIRCVWEDNAPIPAAFLGVDAETGLALLKVDAGALQPAGFCSANAAAVGDAVQIAQRTDTLTICAGTLTAVGDAALDLDAALGTEALGAPLVSGGSVIGLVAAQEDGTAQAVPSDRLPEAVARILSQNPAALCWLGFDVGEIPAALIGYYNYPGSLWVRGIAASQLEADGLHECDVILAVDGVSVESWDAWNACLAAHSPGDTVTLTLYRDGQTLTAALPLRGR